MRSLRGVASITMVLAVGLGGCSTSGSSTERSSSTMAWASPTETPMTSEATSAGSTSDGPVQAAVAYVASTDELMAHSPVGRREIFRKLVTASALDGQLSSFESAAEQLATTLNVPVERLVWVEAPITATLVDDVATSAAVDVWTVSILGSPTTGSPQQVWRTVHVQLELDGGRWLVESATADEGPTPASNELAMQASWKQFDVVASWPAVVHGVGL
jgi:hypothetical protein